MKRILITNDDGYQSPGLLALKEALSPLGHVMIVAPASEKSACGHGMTLTRPLRFIKLDDDFYKLDDGTPTDCIYLSLHALYEEGFKPDLIDESHARAPNLVCDNLSIEILESILPTSPSSNVTVSIKDLDFMES